MIEPKLIVHGGAGKLSPRKVQDARRGILSAVQQGWKTLNASENNTALDAVENAVKVMEDDPNFNAGFGSVLALDGQVYMDASIMSGKGMEAGAICSLQNVRHPIALARKILTETDHVLLSGKQGEALAKLWGLEFLGTKIISENRKQQYKATLEKYLESNGDEEPLLKNRDLIKRFPQLQNEGGTVGAVARDTQGDIAVATSTGGMLLKFPGRVGDTAVIGAGTYAWNEAGGVSATGFGEAGIELCISKTVVDFMAHGSTAQNAVEKGISLIRQYKKGVPFGLIAIDRNGEFGLSHCSEVLVYAARGGSASSYKVGLTENEWFSNQ